mgnify:CR=1 FL=1
MPPTPPARVLCIDDDAELREFLRVHLGREGYTVLLAESGKTGIEAAARAKPDLILLDVALPELDGRHVCSHLHGQPETTYIPVVLVTAERRARDRARALALGAVDYLLKPIELPTLLAKVRQHVQTRARWERLRKRERKEPVPVGVARRLPDAYPAFRRRLAEEPGLSAKQRAAVLAADAADLYAEAALAGIPAARVAGLIADHLGLRFLPAPDPAEVRLDTLPAAFCRSHSVLPLGEGTRKLSFALSNPFRWEVVEDLLQFVDGAEGAELIITEPGALLELTGRAWPSDPAAPPTLEEELRERYRPFEAAAEAEAKQDESNEPIIRLVRDTIEKAYTMRASDIHVEPWEHEVVIRYRVDGELTVVQRLSPGSLIRPIVSRIKVMARLDIAEHRLPQDGRIRFADFSQRGTPIDLRVSTFPMRFGEKAVLRLLDLQKSVMPLESLGFAEENLRRYREGIRSPWGMVLHVGPTGSGKSMTMYAALNEIQSNAINIQTVEDPIEYGLPGVHQAQVHREIGLTFHRALRSFLRQDPDVILVGEIRDRETAEVAVEASLTGHLLLSTLHTNDASSTLVRLIEMGIEPYLVTSSIVLVCAQRLLRRLCPKCRKGYSPGEAERRLVGIGPEEEVVLYRPGSCDECSGIGYYGRIGIHEVLVPDEAVRLAANERGVSADTLKRLGVERCGLIPLFLDAMQKVRAGICSLEDALANVRIEEIAASFR